MRYLVISDIHGNVEALERILEEIKASNPDIIASLGDVVGYGANPGECIDIVQEWAHIRIIGNHDLVAAGLTDSEGFNPAARKAILWTVNSLDPGHRDILEEYDPIRRYNQCLFAHASPVSPLDWEYIYTVGQARKIFEGSSEKYIFIGHTHIPNIIIYNKKEGCRVSSSSMVQVEPESRYLINVGSIGQPRDGIAASSFALLDTKKAKLMIKRVPYDIETAQEKIRSAGLPESLASRLATAR
jgi:predicted phosphodiesterase